MRPPQEFIDHCLTQESSVPINWEQAFNIDEDWWQCQEGYNTEESKTFIDLYQQTYPLFFKVTLKDFDKKALKTDFFQFLKDVSAIFDVPSSQMLQKLKNSAEDCMISEEENQKIKELENANIFLNIVATSADAQVGRSQI